jgi:hypothetical protein
MSNPIPPHLIDEFKALMEMADDDDAPDGAWFQMLEDTASDFIDQHELRACPNDAAHQYIDMCINPKVKVKAKP